jgi:2OG-Fe(II) oxygenase superfamily
MAQTCIYEYGKEILPTIKSDRYYFMIDDTCDESIIKELSLKSKIDFTKYNYKRVEREVTTGFGMKWHIDDAALIKINKDKDKEDKGMVLQNKYRLFHKEELPLYSAILYLSTYNKDFKGGEFHFVDEIITPLKNHVLLFNSKEVHRVSPVKSGIRKNILYKFYK